MRCLAIIPTYREAESLGTCLALIFELEESPDVLVVDDNSPDGTADIVREHPLFGEQLHLLARDGKLGLGSAYRAGFRWLRERDYDIALMMDADLSHDPAAIPGLLAALQDGHDLAIGSRYVPGGGVRNWAPHRRGLSRWASFYTRLWTGLPLRDPTSGFKAIRRSAVELIDWSRCQAEGYVFLIELHHAAWRLDLRLIELPIIFTERREGQSKMSLWIALEAAARVPLLALRR